MCFHGVCKMVFVCSNRSKQNVNIDFFDTQWNHLPFKRHYQNSPYPIKKPKNLEKMISIVLTDIIFFVFPASLILRQKRIMSARFIRLSFFCSAVLPSF